jgi:hypothetical protein
VSDCGGRGVWLSRKMIFLNLYLKNFSQLCLLILQLAC